MAKIKIAKDGHFYLTHGYHLLNSAGKEVKFAGYTVEGGAERVFVRSELAEGDSLPEEVFYALLLDGDLHNEAVPHGIRPSSVPNRVWATVDNELANIEIEALDLSGAKCLLDVLERFSPKSPNSLYVLKLASWIWMYTKRKMYGVKNGGKDA